MKRIIAACFVLSMIALAACVKNGADKQPVIIEMPTATPAQTSPAPEAAPAETAQPESTPAAQPSDESVIAQTPESSKAPALEPGGEGTIHVRGGDTLERDIIPQLVKAFSVSEREVKDAMANADSSLIGKASGFRRMEGIIVPGTYEIHGESMESWLNERISEAERRYERISEQVPEKNELGASERITLASIVEGDTNLAGAFEDIAATVYLNRIKKNDKFGSCPTVEYALGYQRPYLTSEDITVDSPYNTYKHKGLPPGPICCFDDESLKASLSKPLNGELYFFFYDYVKREILSFANYGDFKAAGEESKALFEATFDISRFEKMADKREYFND
ncbi:MAG: putative aminodeoxychorismate lyase [Firmicutes bacterium ADurb.Bin182]|nr:MAG: putative aminodeoxychorismate lyase [Firmicutes bacterium ADurb.Bin182]